MAPSIAYTRASTALASSHPTVLRSLASSNAKCRRVTAVRTLWWWGKHGTWSSSSEENNDERFQRYRKIMIHRYSRAVRRRAMWDRDEDLACWTGRAPDSRPTRKWGAYRAMSSTDPANARLNSKQDKPEENEKFWTEFKQGSYKHESDWEAFKAAIDRDIARDPYATLFGTRLQSPPTQNNSSWISWLFNRNEPVQEATATQLKSTTSAKPSTRRKIEIEVLDKKQTPSEPIQSRSPKPGVSTNSMISSNAPDEYKYDPISGRKILQSSKLDELPKSPQTFLETLFSEHGAEPDKPIKQLQIHGYKSASSKPTVSISIGEAKSETPPEILKGFGSSRTHEYQQLRAATLGNNIDTTAEFGGKFDADPIVPDEVPERRTRIVPEPEENAPLFSGTTYASKADQIVLRSSTRTPSWLEKEGFQGQERGATDQIQSTGSAQQSRLVPSFDRMQSIPETGKKFITKLQPAIDRVQLAKSKGPIKTTPINQRVSSAEQSSKNENISITNFNMQSEAERGEDIDLLRASDIRAATKTMRTTKQEAEQAKSKARNQLEDSFEQVHKQHPEELIPEVKELRIDSGKLARSIENVHKHADQYPNGIVARTMRSIGMINGRFKDYEKPHSANELDLTERLEFGSSALNRLPSIYKRPVQSLNVTPAADMQIVQDELKARTDLTESLRLSSRNADETKKRQDAQIEQLANGIRQIYETEYGPIDLSPAATSTSATQSQKIIALGSPQPAQQSTEFETEQAKFMSEVGQLSKDVQSVKDKTAQLETRWRNNSVTSGEASASIGNLTAEANSYIAKADSLHACFDKQKQVKHAHPLSTATVKPGVPQYPAIERHTLVFEPRYIELLQDVKVARRRLFQISTGLHDLRRSRSTRSSMKLNEASAGSQTASKSELTVESQKATETATPLSPYRVLVYNKTTGEVDKNAMDRLPWSPVEKGEKVNPIRIMGNLNYPAAFVTHFVELEKAGYELSSGGGDMLIFQKKAMSTSKTENNGSESVAPASEMLRNSIATEEASAQPEITETIAQPKKAFHQQAATVLDDIPTGIPTPGPAAPIAPPTVPPPTDSVKRPLKTGPKVRRQEQVFSGTIPIRKPKASKPDNRDDTSSSSSSRGERNNKSTEPDEPFFTRATRAVKRGVLGATAFGATIYTIGVVTEGIGAQAQVEGEEAVGPRRKMVMPMGQRPGIYSTESSRND